MHGDGNLYGSVHRVELFDQWPDKSELKDVVGIMNRSATEDTLSPVWPVISEVLRSTDAPSSAAAEVVGLLDAWVADDAPLLDADEDGFYDRAGALLMDRLWGPIADAVMEPVFGGIQPNTINFRGIGTASLVDKDLRTVLGHQVEGPFNLRYCGGGDLEECSESLWATIERVVSEITAERGDDPSMWLREGLRSSFAPNLIPNTFRSTNAQPSNNFSNSPPRNSHVNVSMLRGMRITVEFDDDTAQALAHLRRESGMVYRRQSTPWSGADCSPKRLRHRLFSRRADSAFEST